ncbi:MAG TPA: asparagine synthase (glutamine-hydrolyzing) [Polyangiaceae bacterium]|nr:asparagine synthase (glutamine-hydrolyzing) [Polyangiaceae bacterium]
MCGIAGVYPNGREPADGVQRAVEAMGVRLMPRGPDAGGIRALGPGAPVLGHRRLAIIDLDARSNQPLSSADGRLAIVFNGEIYNYRELRRDLTEQGEVFRTEGDTEVLLAAFRRHGRGLLPLLRGMFAFAIWDASTRTLLLARDPHGIKPLYYAATRAGFAFASQVKALIASGLVPSELSSPGLAGFYLWGSVPEPWSIERHVLALPAGHWLEVRDGAARSPRAWDDLRRHWRAPAEPLSSAELEARVRAAVLDSVRAHCVADVPVSVFLSGGVDSGAIAGAMAAEGARVEGVTIGCAEFEGRAQDEVPGARAIAERYGIAHHVRTVGKDEFEADLPRIFDAMDQPSIDGINTWFASKAAAERGYKVVLSGVGGDELLCGYGSFERVARAARLGRRVRLLPGLAPLLGGLGALAADALKQPKLARVGAQLASLEGLYQLERGLFFPAELPGLMGEAAAREGLDALGDFAASGAARARDDWASVALLESTSYLRNQLLRDSDWASMAHSLELRTPLCDARLLEALGPYLSSFRGGRGKRWLARCPEPPLDAAIVARDKTGFGLPMAAWLDAPALPSDERSSRPARASAPRAETWARRWARHVAARWRA